MMKTKSYKAFTLIELLVVISIIALLMSVLMPALGSARAIAKKAVCKSNIRQIAIANNLYSQENDGEFVLAATDIYASSGGLSRWHGKRDNVNEAFEFTRSDLFPYLQTDSIKECPEKVDFIDGQTWDSDFEKGGGGYGYNMTYVGSGSWRGGTATYNKATKQSDVSCPSQTVMFADSAMAKLDKGVPYFLEYSFIEPPFFVSRGMVQKNWGYTSPSMHFRHRHKANIVWVDTHVSELNAVAFDEFNAYGVKSSDMGLGWPELNNSLFDLK
ncbi:MAG: type II secretion system protein [Sedimentisphaeraceae bacterium JB056]